MKLKLDDGTFLTVENVHEHGYLPMLECDDGTEWYVAESTEAAGEAAREYWKDMAENDPKEFACMVGEQTLVSWALGQSAGPGSTQVTSLEEWLDLWLDTPEEQWASYDSEEHEVTRSGKIVEELGFTPGVVYRHN